MSRLLIRKIMHFSVLINAILSTPRMLTFAFLSAPNNSIVRILGVPKSKKMQKDFLMRKLFLAAGILFLVGTIFLVLFFANIGRASEQIRFDYSYTTAFCDGKACADFLVVCKDN